MFYEERMIDGEWHFRTTPGGEWRKGRWEIPASESMTPKPTMSLRERLLDLADRIGRAGINGFGNELRDLALSTPQAEGMVLVPLDPTPAMVQAGTLAGMLTPNQACASFQSMCAAMIAATEGSNG